MYPMNEIETDRPAPKTPAFEAALLSFVQKCQEISNAHTRKFYPNTTLATFRIERGPRYAKVVNEASRCVHCFVDTNGDVLKAASWRGPAKHARGNIFSPQNGVECMGPYGPAYLR